MEVLGYRSFLATERVETTRKIIRSTIPYYLLREGALIDDNVWYQLFEGREVSVNFIDPSIIPSVLSDIQRAMTGGLMSEIPSFHPIERRPSDVLKPIPFPAKANYTSLGARSVFYGEKEDRVTDKAVETFPLLTSEDVHHKASSTSSTRPEIHGLSAVSAVPSVVDLHGTLTGSSNANADPIVQSLDKLKILAGDLTSSVVRIDSLSAGSEGSQATEISNIEDHEHSAIEKWLVEFPDVLNVLLAERRMEEALDALDEAERIASEAKGKQTLSPEQLLTLHITVTNDRQILADQLAEAVCQSSPRGVALRTATPALTRIGDGPRAHCLLLNAHYQSLQYNMQPIHLTSTSYGGAYTSALSHQFFSAIAQVVNASMEVCSDESVHTSELVVWSVQQTEGFAHPVPRHTLKSPAAARSLQPAAECVQLELVHCSLLEASGLSLPSVPLKLSRPSVGQALDVKLQEIDESTAALVAADDWVLVYPPSTTLTSGRVSTTAITQPKLSSIAHRFNSMVQNFFEDVGPFLSMQLGGSTMGVPVYPNRRVCISILHPPGNDPNGYEPANTRWTPANAVEGIVLCLISMLSGPTEESPANIKAAKEWRAHFSQKFLEWHLEDKVLPLGKVLIRILLKLEKAPAWLKLESVLLGSSSSWLSVRIISSIEIFCWGLRWNTVKGRTSRMRKKIRKQAGIFC